MNRLLAWDKGTMASVEGKRQAAVFDQAADVLGSWVCVFVHSVCVCVCVHLTELREL